MRQTGVLLICRICLIPFFCYEDPMDSMKDAQGLHFPFLGTVQGSAKQETFL
jgi:hypothetical protein